MAPLIHHTLDTADIIDSYSYGVIPYHEHSMSLLDFLLVLRKKKIMLPLAAQRSLVLQLIDVLAYLHLVKGYAHNDIKPDNILVTISMEQGIQLKLIDFADMTPINQTSTSSPGTKEFRAPEREQVQAHSAGPTDIFSLGATIFTMLNLAFPFDAAKSCLDCSEYLEYFNTPLHQRDPQTFFKRFSAEGFIQPAEDLKTFALSLIALDPKARPTIAEILNSMFIQRLRTQEENNGGHPELYSLYVSILQ